MGTDVSGSTKLPKPLILIADSEIPTAQLMRGVFEYEGYEVVIAQSMPRVFELITARPPDLIVLEAQLGKESGFEVLRRLREDETTSSIPTFLLTTNTDWPDILHGLELGADDTMRKPVHPRELLVRAESKITSRRLKEALQRRTHDLEAILRASELLNGQHDRLRLPVLILTLLNELLPLTAAALIIQHDNGRRTVNAHPAAAQGTIKEWAARIGTRMRLFADMTQIHGLSDSGSTSASIMPLTYLEGREKAFLIAFSDQALDITQVQLMAGIGRQADLALRNADLYQFQANYALQLEAEVQERTRELQSAQNQLVQAEKLATVGRLAAGIAHEINNPLMPIKINLESILEDIQMGSSVEADMVTATLESVDRIQRLVQRLLEYNAGHAVSREEMQPVNINDVVDVMRELTHKTFRQNGKHIALDLHDVPTLIANRDSLTQVFINLALNAAEAMEEGGLLTIETRHEKADVIIRFTDTGRGIAPDMLDRIFDPFMTTKPTGSGLGLFVSYGIIKGHGGAIDVQSRPDEGTTFAIRLPLEGPASD